MAVLPEQDLVVEELLHKMKEALLIFQKNAELGKVKTRLGATVGDKNALLIYTELVRHTHSILQELNVDCKLYFSSHIELNPLWEKCAGFVQSQDDLGSRMKNAIDEQIALGYEKIVVIGTDCYELTTKHLEDAFEALNHSDYVLGPANDGGYYLIGAKKTHDSVFLNKTWSTAKVYEEAIESIKQLNLTSTSIEKLTDVDEEKDLGSLKTLLLTH